MNEDLLQRPDLGENNTFNDFHIEHIDNFNPNATTVNNHYYNTERARSLVITKIINRLSDPNIPPVDPKKFDTRLYGIPEKIAYNNLKRWKNEVNYFAPHRLNVDAIYQEFLKNGQNKREKVYHFLHSNYALLREEFEADVLFDKLKAFVYNLVKNDISLFDTMDLEDIDYNICIVLVDAFIECEIFEKPK